MSAAPEPSCYVAQIRGRDERVIAVGPFTDREAACDWCDKFLSFVNLDDDSLLVGPVYPPTWILSVAHTTYIEQNAEEA